MNAKTHSLSPDSARPRSSLDAYQIYRYGRQVKDTNTDTIHSGYARIRTHTLRIRKDTRPYYTANTRHNWTIRGSLIHAHALIRDDRVDVHAQHTHGLSPLAQTVRFASQMFPLKNLGLLIICGVFFIHSWTIQY